MRVGGDHIERDGGHGHHQRADQYDSPIVGQGSEDLRSGRVVFASYEFIGFLERRPEPEEKWDDYAAEKKGDAPAPLLHFFRRKNGVQNDANGSGEHHRNLLAAGLPAYVETFVARSGDFGEIHGDAAEFHASRKTLKKAAENDEQRGQKADGGVAVHEGDGKDTDGHQSEGEKQTSAAGVSIGGR